MGAPLSELDFTLVLGGGGLKGLAHVGVLSALEELGIRPKEVVGSSIGALVGASWCAGTEARELRAVAYQVRRRDIFRVAHTDMALKRMRSPALYRRSPLAELTEGLLGNVTFEDLPHPVFVNTVDLNSGQQVLWGVPGLRNVRVADAVYASCALPGYLPPQEINGRYYADGGTVENLPVAFAATRARSLIVAVDVGSTAILRPEVHNQGFAAVYARSIEIALQTMREQALKHWSSPPLLFVQPRVDHVSWFSFRHNRELVREGYVAAKKMLSDINNIPTPDMTGVYPKRRVHLRVERNRCIGCGACLVHAPPGTFALDGSGKATLLEPEQCWSPVDGGFVHQCPTSAIVARALDGDRPSGATERPKHPQID